MLCAPWPLRGSVVQANRYCTHIQIKKKKVCCSINKIYFSSFIYIVQLKYSKHCPKRNINTY